MTARPCELCGSPFEPKRHHARYCSSRCRSLAHQDRVAAAVEASDLPARPGQVRADIEAYLRDRGLIDHPLTSAVLTVADRIDAGRDPLAGVVAALRQLERTLATITDLRDDETHPDLIDLMKLRRAVRRVGGEEKVAALAAVLDDDTVAAIARHARAAYGRRQFTQPTTEEYPHD
jgi:hypothetical protein